eukprot:368947-Pelagomonas_calceolata.AAC.1
MSTEASPRAEVAGLGRSKPQLLEPLLPNFACSTPGHQNLTAPFTRFAWPAFQVSGRMVGWAGCAGHLLLSYQTEKFQSTLHRAPTQSQIPLTSQGLLKVSAWPACRVSGRGVRCAEGDKPRGLRPMNGASPKMAKILY